MDSIYFGFKLLIFCLLWESPKEYCWRNEGRLWYHLHYDTNIIQDWPATNQKWFSFA